MVNSVILRSRRAVVGQDFMPTLASRAVDEQRARLGDAPPGRELSWSIYGARGVLHLQRMFGEHVMARKFPHMVWEMVLKARPRDG